MYGMLNKYMEINNMEQLKFNTNKSLVKLAKETIMARNFNIAYEEQHTFKKCFYLVKDDGIYLMPAYKISQTAKENKTVIYASGFNPKYNKNVWEDSYHVSRDDFVENVYLSIDQLKRIANGGSVDIGLAEDSIEVRA